MTDQALPNDILREVSKYWHGHALAYTCTALYASWDPEDYLIAEHHECGAFTTRMPNGAYHGISSIASDLTIETVVYDRGNIVSATRIGGYKYTVKIIINGWECQWYYWYNGTGSAYLPGGTRGGVLLSTYPVHLASCRERRWINGVSLRDFHTTVWDTIKQQACRGVCDSLGLFSSWGIELPHTYRC